MTNTFQLTSRSLSILALVAVVGCSWRSAADQQAVDTITGRGGTFETSSDGTIHHVHLGATRTNDSDLRALAGLTRVAGLDLNQTDVTYAGLAHLKGMSNLQGLNLIDTRVTDAGLVQLAALASLTYVDLDGTKVTSTGVEKLHSALPKCKIRYTGRDE